MELVGLNGFTQLLQKILGAVFDSVLSPVLRDVFNVLVNIYGEMMNELYASFRLQIWIIFLKLVYFMEEIFGIFSGVSPVQIKNGDVSEKMSLLEYFLTEQSGVTKAFWYITLIAMALAFLTTIFGIMKSMSDMVLENKNPLSAVLRRAFRAAVTFLLIPISCLFLLRMSTTLIAVVNTTFNYENADASLSDTIFITTALPAAKDQKSAEDTYSAGRKFQNADQVKKDFNIEKIDYTQAYVSSILIAMILLCSILQFIQRIFMVLLLYLVSPFFVAMIPLDGGAKFKEWRDMFVAHMFSAFGPIFAMKLYLIVVPMVASGNLSFGSAENVSNWIQLFFIIGGAFAVYRSRLLLISVINPAAAGAMAESGIIGAIIGGKVMGFLGKAVGSLGGGAAKKMVGSAGSPGASGASGGAGQFQTKSQAYTGK